MAAGKELHIIPQGKQWSHKLRYGLILLSVAVITFLGYLGFVFFLKEVMPAFTVYGLFLVAIVAGIATFFSPCSFPLLPGYLSFYYENSPGRRGNSLLHTIAPVAGVVTFNLLLGAVIALLGEGLVTGLSVSNPNPSQFTRFLRIGIGTALMILGAGQFSNVTFHFRTLDSLTQRFSAAARSGDRGLYLYGFGYNAAGIGCAGPIMAGLIIFALGSGGFVSAFSAFVVYSLTMASLMLLVSLLVVNSRNILIQNLKASTPKIKRVTSLILIAVGAFLIYATVNLQFFVQTFFPK